LLPSAPAPLEQMSSLRTPHGNDYGKPLLRYAPPFTTGLEFFSSFKDRGVAVCHAGFMSPPVPRQGKITLIGATGAEVIRRRLVAGLIAVASFSGNESGATAQNARMPTQAQLPSERASVLPSR
jgi:hypothetical protein